jgi:hypothetical protein
VVRLIVLIAKKKFWEEKEKEWGYTEGYSLGEGGGETVYPVLEVPRQCPHVLLVEVMHMIVINSFI